MSKVKESVSEVLRSGESEVVQKLKAMIAKADDLTNRQAGNGGDWQATNNYKRGLMDALAVVEGSQEIQF